MDPRTQSVDCDEHGYQQATFTCRHIVASLSDGAPIGFWTSGDRGVRRPDAWCNACEARVQATDGAWTDESESYAGVTLLCAACYDRAHSRRKAS